MNRPEFFTLEDGDIVPTQLFVGAIEAARNQPNSSELLRGLGGIAATAPSLLGTGYIFNRQRLRDMIQPPLQPQEIEALSDGIQQLSNACDFLDEYAHEHGGNE